MNFCGFNLQGEESQAPSSQQEMLRVFELLKPKPSSHPLIRIGDNRDGSYLVPDDLVGITACFSPGVNNFKHFEDLLVDTYGIECHMCDYSSDEHKFKTPLKEGKQSFLKKWLDVRTEGNNISLDDWINGKSPCGDLLLQIDIEGAEYRNLLSVSDDVLSRFRIVVLEVHGLPSMRNAAVLRNVMAPFFERLSKFFSVVHAHPNNCCGDFAIPGTSIRIPNVLELTYIRNDRLDSAIYRPLLPHPLDVSRNVPLNPPLFLGEEWLENGRALESRVKMLEDQILSAPPAGITVEESNLIARSLQTITEKAAALTPQSRGGANSFRDVAAGRPYVLSSSYASASNTGIVHREDKYFFHTKIGRNQFIKVDLGDIFSISKIQITNRMDACPDRARSLFAILSEVDDRASKENVFYIHTPATFLSGETKICEIAIPTTRARFVVLTSPVETALHFSDLKVFTFD